MSIFSHFYPIWCSFLWCDTPSSFVRLFNRSFVHGYLTSLLSSLNNHYDIIYSSMVLVVSGFVWFIHHAVLNMKWWFSHIELFHRIVLLKYVTWRRHYFWFMKSSTRTSFSVNSIWWIDVYHLHPSRASMKFWFHRTLWHTNNDFTLVLKHSIT